MPLKKKSSDLTPDSPGFIAPDSPFTKDLPAPAKQYVPGVQNNPLNPRPYQGGDGAPDSDRKQG